MAKINPDSETIKTKRENERKAVYEIGLSHGEANHKPSEVSADTQLPTTKAVSQLSF